MPFLALHVVCSLLPDLLHVFRRSNHDQAVKLPRLRQPLRVYERKAKQPRLSRYEKEFLASLVARLAALSPYPGALARRREPGMAGVQPACWSGLRRPAGDLPPGSDAVAADPAILPSRQTVVAGAEVGGDQSLGGEEALGVPGGFAAAHPSFALAGRLVRVLCPVVHALVSPMLHARQHLSLRRCAGSCGHPHFDQALLWLRYAE